MNTSVIKAIARISSGFPHFTHLLALKCAEEAVSNGPRHITKQNLSIAIKNAVEDAEGTLRRKYFEATRSHSTDMYANVLLAAAKLRGEEFTAKMLRKELSDQIGRTINQGELNNYLKRLVSENQTCLLQRTGKGVYRFSDPRMASFIKVAQEDIPDEDNE